MNYKAGIEGLLFLVGDEGASLKEISKIFEIKIAEVKGIIEELKNDLESEDRGLGIIEYNGKLKFTTKQQYFDLNYTKLVEEKKKRGLSQAALETLAIIAYNQPFSRSEIENIRGIAHWFVDKLGSFLLWNSEYISNLTICFHNHDSFEKFLFWWSCFKVL